MSINKRSFVGVFYLLKAVFFPYLRSKNII